MAEMVHCDVCGKLYSSRHLKSHKRLAHGKTQGQRPLAALSEPDAIQTILTLFDGLSAKNKKLVTKRLGAHAPAAADHQS